MTIYFILLEMRCFSFKSFFLMCQNEDINIYKVMHFHINIWNVSICGFRLRCQDIFCTFQYIIYSLHVLAVVKVITFRFSQRKWQSGFFLCVILLNEFGLTFLKCRQWSWYFTVSGCLRFVFLCSVFHIYMMLIKWWYFGFIFFYILMIIPK